MKILLALAALAQGIKDNRVAILAVAGVGCFLAGWLLLPISLDPTGLPTDPTLETLWPGGALIVAGLGCLLTAQWSS